MTVDLADFVDSLRREITPLGTTLFASTNDDTLAAHLVDAFWEAKLDGFLEGYSSDEDGLVTGTSGDLPRSGVALVVLYAGIRILRNRILNLNTQFRAKAGPAEFEQQNSATVLAEMLRQLRGVKDRLMVNQAGYGNTDVEVFDAFSTRLFNPHLYYGSELLS